MPSFLDSLLGSKPVVPNLPVLNLGTEQQTAIKNNQAALPAAENLVGSANQFSIDQINQMLQQAIPGYSSMVQTATGNIASELKGQIPTDVAQQVQNSDAARALGGGYGGSGAHGDLVARDLGLTSLNLTQQGLSSFENWTRNSAALYEPSMINVSSMFITPMQQYQTDNEQNVQQFQRQWMQNQINAQPAMWAQAFKEAVQTAISMYSGDSSGIQHAGTYPVQGSGVQDVAGVDSGGFGASNSGGFSDYAGGGGMDMGDSGMGAGSGSTDMSGFGGFA
ncbi:hypothetical protein KGP36_02625 [Patescibacteria group bacterium]|nr:hypothetical protein [Patescibacteria group bacterium]